MYNIPNMESNISNVYLPHFFMLATKRSNPFLKKCREKEKKEPQERR